MSRVVFFIAMIALATSLLASMSSAQVDVCMKDATMLSLDLSNCTAYAGFDLQEQCKCTQVYYTGLFGLAHECPDSVVQAWQAACNFTAVQSSWCRPALNCGFGSAQIKRKW